MVSVASVLAVSTLRPRDYTKYTAQIPYPYVHNRIRKRIDRYPAGGGLSEEKPRPQALLGEPGDEAKRGTAYTMCVPSYFVESVIYREEGSGSLPASCAGDALADPTTTAYTCLTTITHVRDSKFNSLLMEIMAHKP